MNILIKLMSIVSLVIAPTLAKIHHDKIVNNRHNKLVNLMQIDSMALINTHNNAILEKKPTRNAAPNNNDIKYLLGGLKNDGLITTENYTVEIRDGRLIIDGIEQNDEVNNKYEKYLAGKGDMIIKEQKVIK